MFKFSLLLLLGLHTIQATEIELKRYTISELEMMAKKKEWANIVLFIKDIPKADQDLQWNRLLERASVGYVTDLKKGEFPEVERVMHDLLVEFPTLRKSHQFESIRNEILLSGFQNCFSRASDGPFCAKEGMKQMQNEFSSEELRQRLGQLISKKHPDSKIELCQIFKSYKEHKGFFEKYCLEIKEKNRG